MWKAIGHSIEGTSHTSSGKVCEDALAYNLFSDTAGNEVLVCCVSDGAGSAQYAAWASVASTTFVASTLTSLLNTEGNISVPAIYHVFESAYDLLENAAIEREADISEFACTMLGCVVSDSEAIFFQLGDGAIARDDGSGNFVPVTWPQNGEYHNVTSFITDDRSMGNLVVVSLEERVAEVAIFTDGLQMLALNMEQRSVHQPFFAPLFRYLRLADDETKLQVLSGKLKEYLDSKAINNRTDDDKTLFLATRGA